MKMVVKNRVNDKGDIWLTLCEENEESVRMQIMVKNRVNYKGDIWLTLCEADWGEGENEEGGEK